MAPTSPSPPDPPRPRGPRPPPGTTLRETMAAAARHKAAPPRGVYVLWALVGAAVLGIGVAQIAGWTKSPVAERVLERRRADEAANTPAKAPEGATRTVLLRRAGERPAEVVEAIRSATGLSARDAKAVVDGAPKEVVSGVPPAEAERVRALLEAAGATVEVR